METERLRIEEDLRGQLAGEVRCDDVFVELYASDASLFQIRPLGVVRPRTVEDVSAVARYAAENHLSLHPRGAGSSLCGGPLGDGLIVDFSRYFRRIVDCNEHEATVQAGVVLERLNRQLSRYDAVFGPDPPNRLSTTMGGVLARDASGSRWLAYGSASRYVRSVEAVLADGSVVRFDAESSDPSVERLASGVRDVAARHAEALATPISSAKVDRSGYAIAEACREGRVDLARLMAGCEGTLALVTQATFEVCPLPEAVGSCLLMFNSLQEAAEAAVELGTRPLRDCDLLERRHLSLARELDPRYDLMVPANVEAVLLVELEGATHERMIDGLRDVENLVVMRRRLAAGALLAI
ncbi:MAG: FAD-binding oxidoreductase, partial [Planctomycetales bacterium]|nr:FAD-binding oxidoreductase [Planctomycetales bacterium]